MHKRRRQQHRRLFGAGSALCAALALLLLRTPFDAWCIRHLPAALSPGFLSAIVLLALPTSSLLFAADALLSLRDERTGRTAPRPSPSDGTGRRPACSTARGNHAC